MMGMKVRLGDYISEYSVRNKAEDDIPVYSVTNTQGFCQDYFGKEVASKDKSTYKIVPKGYFAYNPSRINVGSVDWQRNEKQVIVSPLYNVFSVTSGLDQQYLYYFLKSEIALHLIQAAATGSVRDNLKFSMLSDFIVNLPPIAEQKEIVYTLDKIKTVISCRQQQLSALDDLIKARFVEMFGDPIENPKHLETIRGEDFFKLSNGKFVPEQKRFENGIPIYGGNGISWYTDDVLVQEDTLVVGRVGFQSGNVHLAKAPLWVSDNAMYVSYYNQDEYNLIFLCDLMKHIDFTRHQDAGDLKKITQKPFMTMQFIHPTIVQQREYIAFVEQVDKSKFVCYNYTRYCYKCMPCNTKTWRVIDDN